MMMNNDQKSKCHPNFRALDLTVNYGKNPNESWNMVASLYGQPHPTFQKWKNLTHRELDIKTSTSRYSQQKSKIGTLMLIGIVSICGALTAIVLPTPLNLIAIGFGGPIVSLVKRLLK